MIKRQIMLIQRVAGWKVVGKALSSSSFLMTGLVVCTHLINRSFK